jgi:hypothetical protein
VQSFGPSAVIGKSVKERGVEHVSWLKEKILFPFTFPLMMGGKLCSLMQKTSADLNMQGMESVFLLGFSVGSAISGTSKAEI